VENGGEQQVASERDYSTYTKVPRYNRDLLFIFHRELIPHIEEVEGLANYLLQKDRQNQKKIDDLDQRLKALEARLAKNSSNSHKPPSTDLNFKKRRSLREKSGKKQGGQPGHKGACLEKVNHPDFVECHRVESCTHCQSSLTDTPVLETESRQVFDLPKVKLQVTEHRVETKLCSTCGKQSSSSFPSSVRGEVQYGPNFKALCAYFMHTQFIPLKRCAQLCSDLFQAPVSTGTLVNFQRELFKRLENTEQQIKSAIIASEMVYFDETPMRVNKAQAYIHVASTKQLTYLYAHASRGLKAVNEMGILPRFKGLAIHDEYPMYFGFTQCCHTVCKPHILRELQFVHETEKEDWAGDMKKCIEALYYWTYIQSESEEKSLHLGRELERYEQIIKLGLGFHEKLPKPPDKRKVFSDTDPLVFDENGDAPLYRYSSTRKQRAGKNLLDRLLKRKNEILMFVFNPNAPYSNNQAERDFRMEKVKQKISGCFRNLNYLKFHCRVRSYLSSCSKQKKNLIESLVCAFQNKPILLTIRVVMEPALLHSDECYVSDSKQFCKLNQQRRSDHHGISYFGNRHFKDCFSSSRS
jgi:transposase